MIWLKREHSIVFIILIAAAALLAFISLYNRARFSSPRDEPLLIESPFPKVESADVVLVHVAGKVKSPGVYSLKYGSRVQDALQKAGGPTKDADPHALNLAAFLKDGDKIEVPGKSQAIAEAPIFSSMTATPDTNVARQIPSASTHSVAKQNAKPPVQWLAKHRVNLNRAGIAQLQQLPGIGPAMAQRILAYRRDKGGFSSIEDLKNVSGIGEKRFAALRGLVTI